MVARLSSPALRVLLFDLASELATYNSSELPNGATAYDNQSAALYRLNKTAGTTYDTLIGSGQVIKPDDQTDARWIAESINGASPYFHSSYLNGTVSVTMAGTQWGYLGNVAGTFAVSTGSGAVFAIDNATGEVTYHGPPVGMLVSATISLANADSATPITVAGCISRNDDVVAGSTTAYAVKGQQEADIGDGVVIEMTLQRVMTLNPGTTLRLALRNLVNGDDLQALFYQLSVTPF